ncbi:sugar ABC transporter substrate-binding protein [Clostridium paridis]|uniref:Substrate-binding domain-containing protein n=1 Tax=Clostridium paridis TaxID=2803863 RepID=A0A937FEW8_9CLOT|nr:substrate-binding domain-containing protein [Clostridium paridis]MBL4931630.1 substrate-binding domain-containing protein [Clostridium paridis]
MYQAIPDSFAVPIIYVNNNILEIKINEIHNRKQIIIGVSLPNQGIPRWVKDKEFMEKYGYQRNVIMKIKNANYDIDLQGKQVKELISENIDVLIIAPLDSIASADSVNAAKDEGVIVISYDGLVSNAKLDLFVTFDSTQVGELQGKYLTQVVPRGNYIIMYGDHNDPNSKLYKDGAMEYIKPLVNIGSINIVTDKEIINWYPENAYKIVKDSLIANNNNVNAILAPNDDTAGSAIRALEEQGLAGKVAVTGQDATIDAIKRIIKGTQSMTVFNDSRELAKVAIDSAIKLVNNQFVEYTILLNNGKEEVPTIIIPPILVTRNNITQTIINSGYWKSEEIYIL